MTRMQTLCTRKEDSWILQYEIFSFPFQLIFNIQRQQVKEAELSVFGAQLHLDEVLVVSML